MAGPRGLYRSIHCSLIDDPEFQELAPDARLVFLMLRLSRDCNVSCIFRFYIVALAEQTGLDRERIKLCLKELDRTGWIRWDSDASVVWIKNGLRYTPGMERINEKQAKGVINHLNALPHTELIKEFLLHYPCIEAGGIDRLSIGGRGAIDRGSGGYSELKPTSEHHSIPVSVSGSVTESVSLSEGDESPIFGDTGEEGNPPSLEEANKVAKALREAALEATGGKGKLQPEYHDLDRIMVLLLRSNYTCEDLLAMIEFAKGNSFWRAHVLSGGDLEKHADTLYAKMQAEEAEPPKEQGRPQPPMVNPNEYGSRSGSSPEIISKVMKEVREKIGSPKPGSTTP